MAEVPGARTESTRRRGCRFRGGILRRGQWLTLKSRGALTLSGPSAHRAMAAVNRFGSAMAGEGAFLTVAVAGSERPLRVDGGRSATGSGTATAGGKRTHASQQESSIRLLRRRQRATRAAVAGRVAGAVLWFTTNSNSVVQRLPSSDLCKACFSQDAGSTGQLTSHRISWPIPPTNPRMSNLTCL